MDRCNGLSIKAAAFRQGELDNKNPEKNTYLIEH